MKLMLNDKNQDVLKLQTLLVSVGYTSLKLTGVFDKTTEDSLKDYQTKLGVNPDGILGDWVYKKLLEKGGKKTMSKIITLTAGHSNTDPGAVNGATKEADIAVEFRNGVAKYLQNKGYTVRTDGTGTTNNSLNEAIKLIKGSDIAIEFHLNASSSSEAKGVEALSLDKDKTRCQALCKAVSNVLGNPLRGDNGWKPQDSGQHTRLGYCLNGGIILESFFVSNNKELGAYNLKKEELFKAIAETIIQILG